MELNNFERLEEKIVQAIELIGRLKQENQEISSSYKTLVEEMRSFETTVKSSNVEAEICKRELATKERDFSQKKEELKRRVQKLMEKLALFEDLGDSGLKNQEN